MEKATTYEKILEQMKEDSEKYGPVETKEESEIERR